MKLLYQKVLKYLGPRIEDNETGFIFSASLYLKKTFNCMFHVIKTYDVMSNLMLFWCKCCAAINSSLETLIPLNVFIKVGPIFVLF